MVRLVFRPYTHVRRTICNVQYRFGLPSGFPLTSSCTSIVHHLSGPNIHAQARTFIRRISHC
eukprot:UN02373